MLVLLTLARTITNVKGRTLLGLQAHEVQEAFQILGHLGIWVTLSSFHPKNTSLRISICEFFPKI